MNRANGDTAQAAPRYSDDQYESAKRTYSTYALYTMREYAEFAPFARIEVSGVTIRIETDGNGRLIEYVERTRANCYGVPRDRLYVEERPDTPQQPRSGYDLKRAERRRRRMRRIVRWLRVHPNSTKYDISERFGISNSAAWHDLNELRRQGRVKDTARHSGRGRQTSFWNAT